MDIQPLDLPVPNLPLILTLLDIKFQNMIVLAVVIDPDMIPPGYDSVVTVQESPNSVRFLLVNGSTVSNRQLTGELLTGFGRIYRFYVTASYNLL